MIGVLGQYSAAEIKELAARGSAEGRSWAAQLVAHNGPLRGFINDFRSKVARGEVKYDARKVRSWVGEHRPDLARLFADPGARAWFDLQVDEFMNAMANGHR